MGIDFLSSINVKNISVSTSTSGVTSCASTCMRSPIICGTSCTVSPIVYGGITNSATLTLNGTTSGTTTSSKVVLQPTGGNVGIGTTAPGALLTVASGDLWITSGNGTTRTLYAIVGSDETDTGTFNVGIARTNNAGAKAYTAYYRDATSGRGSIGFITTEPGVATANRMTIAYNGDVYINYLPSYGSARVGIYESAVKWAQMIRHDNATTQYYTTFKYLTTEIGMIMGNNTNITYATSSDYRLKEDLKDFNGIDLVSKIKVYDFAWKNNNGRRMYGVLAHELSEVIPYAITKGKDLLKEDGSLDIQGTDYSLITPILVKAVQEQQSQIESLLSRIETLETK